MNMKVWFYLFWANVFWAGNFIFGTFVVPDISPLWATFARWFFSLFLLLPIAYFTENPKWEMIKNEWISLFLMGFLGITGYNFLLLKSLEFTSATNAALVSSLQPGVIVLFSYIFLREKLSFIQVSGLIISFLGVLIILTKGNLFELFLTRYNQGDLLMLVAVILWSFYSLISKRLKTPPITATAVSSFFSVLIMFPFTLFEGLEMTKIGSMAIIGIIYMALFPCVSSYILWNLSVRKIGLSKSGISLNLIPLMTALMAITIGGKITSAQIYGGLFVLLGVYLTTGVHKGRFKLFNPKGQF
ncbi:DMT family transporter [Bacillus salipaludis]|uniref:DMT family transporter n=1 Tax=Bacillus salipaludis TaxID=2547811 RepID=A0A4V3AT81_9BACI|nr:DMT family transporter [Bacillus salipaludis]MDQ6599090.1 DMT family transporter [Bacillus salipaludis]TDK58742.1 DMT family transporter [Bacillus salipaludis]